MPTTAITPERLQPLLADCGYTPDRLAVDYCFGKLRVPLAGFYGRPWDTRSACISVVTAKDNGREAAAACATLGAPASLVCMGDHLELWGLGPREPNQSNRVAAGDVEQFFRKHHASLSPEAIYASKMRRPTRPPEQMWFVDVGLMPSVERCIGEMLHRLVEEAIQGLASRLKGQLRSHKNYADLYKTVFWLLAAKLLHEKNVANFRRIDLKDVDEVFSRVGRHYADIDDLPPGGRAWRPAINEAAERVAQWGHLGNISAESLAYLYETALIDAKPRGRGAQRTRAGRDIRKELGIHSTPPVLVDHMLSQLWPLVEDIPVERRHVFEPACGHAGFLVAAMRWMRDFSDIDDGASRHRYLRERLHGVEIDPFARQLAKLQLTLADVPHGNSWRIDDADMFMPGVLEQATANCTLMLANPPFEAFTLKQKANYKRKGTAIEAQTKAVEMLNRTLPNLPSDGVFGVVMPVGVLHSKEARPVRELLLADFDLTEISIFADNLFEHGDQEVAVLMGKRRRPRSKPITLHYRRVREDGMQAFKERLAFSWKRKLPQNQFVDDIGSIFLVPELGEVWAYLSGGPSLGDIATIGQGLAFKGKTLPRDAWTIHDPPHASNSLGVANVPSNLFVFDTPPRVGINLDRRVLLHVRFGMPTGTSQVLLNYAPVARKPWKLKATLDEAGHALTSRFSAIRPKPEGPSALYFWAIMNSPVANAFAYCQLGKRDILVGTMRRMPVPPVSASHELAIEQTALRYRDIATTGGPLFNSDSTDDEIKHALLAMDAAVLRAYDLPPRLERQLLDLFSGMERKGVGCDFRGYYPQGMDAFVPLHELISDEYARSTLGQFRQHHEPTRDPSVLTALRTAVSAFTEE